MRMSNSQKYILRSCPGFTLVEIMVTLVVMAIAAALAAPSLLAMAPNMALKAAARDLYSKLQEAKMLAIKENNPVTVRFTGSYYYLDIDRSGNYSTVDTFTDENGDGVYNTGEPFNDVDGNGAFTGDIAINFSDYGYGIQRGTGNASKNWAGNDFVNPPVSDITFNPRGSSSSRSVYLDNANDPRSDGVCYGISVRSAGSIKTWKYSGATPFHKKYWN